MTDKAEKGILYVVGTGPGAVEHLTAAAAAALSRAEVVVGYVTYLRQIATLITGKEQFGTGMRKEQERVKKAIELAVSGRMVALVSGGDAGIYGMAGLVLELLSPEDMEALELEIIPGVTAASAAASMVGAPLMHDFAVISLSDLLTDRALIEKRLNLAAEGDFVTILYNPKSRSRTSLIRRAAEIFLEQRSSDTPVAVVTNALRPESESTISTLGAFDPDSPKITMSSVVIIGNSSSYLKGPWFVTPRGYCLQEKEESPS
jgi:precorrin-3B C17-methyltransferase